MTKRTYSKSERQYVQRFRTKAKKQIKTNEQRIKKLKSDNKQIKKAVRKSDFI